MGLILASGMLAPTWAATVFDGSSATDDFISNSGNWDNGLPTGQQGTIAIDATYDANLQHAGYDILHTAGSLSRGNGFTSFDLGTGTTYVMNGAGAEITQTRGIVLGESSSFTLTNGTADLSDNNRDTQIFGANASMTISGGALTIGRDLINRNGGTFTVSGGIITGIDQFLTQSFASSSNGWNFNGGSTTADNFQLDTAGTAYFGGSTAGTLNLLVGLGNGVTLDWSSGSLMELTVNGADQAFYEGLYSGGTLLFEGSNGGSFGDSFTVSGSTLSLVPEPSVLSLLPVVLILSCTRRRRT